MIYMASSLNTSPPSAAYTPQWIGSTLVQMMACHLFGSKPLSKSMLRYCQLDPRNKLQRNFNQNIICEMVAILSKGRLVKTQSAMRLCFNLMDILNEIFIENHWETWRTIYLSFQTALYLLMVKHKLCGRTSAHTMMTKFGSHIYISVAGTWRMT